MQEKKNSMKKVFFSIIIPTYNSSLALEKCLESVISQTFSNFEILIIDGVSSDSTIQIAKKFNDTRVKIFSELDKGIYNAMNKGIKHAIGDCFYFMGSDDYFVDKFVLRDIYYSFKSNNIIYGNVLLSSDNSIYEGKFDANKICKKNISHQAIFYRKMIFKKIGDFNLKYKVFADYDFNLRWFFRSDIKYEYVERVIAVYNSNGYSSTNCDEDFFNVFYEKLFWLGLKVFDLKKQKELLSQILNTRKKNNETFFYFLYLILYYIYRVIDIIKRRISFFYIK